MARPRVLEVPQHAPVAVGEEHVVVGLGDGGLRQHHHAARLEVVLLDQAVQQRADQGHHHGGGPHGDEHGGHSGLLGSRRNRDGACGGVSV